MRFGLFALALACAPGVVLTAGSGDVPQDRVEAPRRTVYVPPQYTAVALRARIEGQVVLSALIGTDGRPENIRVVKSLDRVFGLDEAAIETVKRWRYEPARRNGEAIAITMMVTVTFSLSPPPTSAPAWPELFGKNEALDPAGEPWTSQTLDASPYSVQVSIPKDWAPDTHPASGIARMVSADGLRAVGIGTPRLLTNALPSFPFTDPQLRAVLRAIAESTTASPVATGAFGQVRIEKRWWIWSAVRSRGASDESRTWVFSTFDRDHMIQVLCSVDAAGGPDGNAALERAGKEFAAILRRINIRLH